MCVAIAAHMPAAHTASAQHASLCAKAVLIVQECITLATTQSRRGIPACDVLMLMPAAWGNDYISPLPDRLPLER